MYALVRSVTKFLKAGMYDYCNLESVDDNGRKDTLITKDGGMTSVVEVKGGLAVIGTSLFNEQVKSLTKTLTGSLGKPGFRIQFVFSRDPSVAYRDVRRSIKTLSRTVNKLEMDLEELINEREKVLGGKTSSERCYMVITTLPTVLPPAAIGRAMKDRTDKIKKGGIGIKPGEFAQSPFTAVDAIRENHTGLLDVITNELGSYIELEVLSCAEAIHAIRYEIDNEMTGDDWRPALLGDKISPRLVKESKYVHDVSHVMNPDLSFQLFTQRPNICREDSSMVKMGSKYIAPMMVDIPQQDVTPFKKLFNSIPNDIPWRFSMTLETGHSKVMSKVSNKHTFASFLAFSNSENKLIKEAAEELMEIAKEEVLLSCSMNIATWGDDLKQTTKRKQIVTQCMQNWGSIGLIDEMGDAVEAWCNNIPAFSAKPISTQFPLPLRDAISILPITRPASPWKEGSILFRTIDNKLYPYLPGSAEQTSWTDLVFAPPGFGKSFYLSASNMALITRPGNAVLPRISIIDIGFSSASFVKLVKDSLPEQKKHLAEYFKMENTMANAINPFDTPLGCRKPLSVDREFLVNFLTLLLSPAGIKEPVARLPEIVGSLIDAMYESFSDDNKPQVYEMGYSAEIDEAIERYGITVHDETTWWNIVDALKDEDETLLATRAQRFAVPTLSDATSVLSNDNSIKEIFGEAKYQGENLLKFITSMIVSSLKEFPILTQPTVFDTGSARVISVDLSSVAKSGSAQADKKTGVFYMLARQATCKEFYRNSDTIDEIPAKYKKYHAEIIERDSLAPKKLCMDEFHRTKACIQVREQAALDIREGRKFGVHIALLSQRLDDFDEAMIEFATNVYILKGNSDEVQKKIKAKFNPSADALEALGMHVKGPSKEGSTMLYLGELAGRPKVEQVLRLTLGPVECWAYSTTHEDVQIRNKLSNSVGLNNCLKILSTEFPGGSAKKYIQNRCMKDEMDSEEDNIYEILKQELIIKHKELIAA
ncbi:hypothetical protein [Vibrio harveyi]|uniref:hypothetical protein n=1 Tax=Vibrio harveyi TaxID=669 RepID=UPI003CF1CBE5